MKQHWLFEPPPADTSAPTVELGATTHAELVNLMAIAIASVHCEQANLPQHIKEASHERIAIISQDHSATPQPQSHRLFAAILTQTSR